MTDHEKDTPNTMPAAELSSEAANEPAAESKPTKHPIDPHAMLTVSTSPVSKR